MYTRPARRCHTPACAAGCRADSSCVSAAEMDNFPEGEVDPATGEVVNAPGTLPGEVAIAPCDADDEE